LFTLEPKLIYVLNLIPLHNWLPNAAKPIIISGPCSAETEQQVMLTAEGLAKSGKVNILRAGIWKPRTRPEVFEGVGETALPWLVNAGKKYGFLTTTEVANAAHVEACLNAGVDILWIGARTVTNPFSVQEIADAIKGKNIPVFIKNPINPDLQLWIGAIERIYNSGNPKIVAVHRGFSTSEKMGYRNAPMWEIPIELKRKVPGIEIICDPSHISGNRTLIQSVAQKALDLDMCGLMIESHIDPDHALSDAAQQLTPDALTQLLDQLVLRNTHEENQEYQNRLAQLRKLIDELDENIIQLLADRMNISEKIGAFKKENDITILQMDRWKHIFETRSEQGKALGLSEEFLKKYLEMIHKESIKRQSEVMNR
jgi:chorismate mutase